MTGTYRLAFTGIILHCWNVHHHIPVRTQYPVVLFKNETSSAQKNMRVERRLQDDSVVIDQGFVFEWQEQGQVQSQSGYVADIAMSLRCVDDYTLHTISKDGSRC